MISIQKVRNAVRSCLRRVGPYLTDTGSNLPVKLSFTPEPTVSVGCGRYETMVNSQSQVEDVARELVKKYRRFAC